MKEAILLFNFEQSKARKLAAQLMIMKFRVKVVKEEEWRYPIGYLCGSLEETEEKEAAKENINLDSPMLVMAGVDSKRLNQVLTAIKKSGIGKIPYKAVVTETNQHWLPYALLEELKQEHKQMENATEENAGGFLHKDQPEQP